MPAHTLLMTIIGRLKPNAIQVAWLHLHHSNSGKNERYSDGLISNVLCFYYNA
jgi:hypothetical protein